MTMTQADIQRLREQSHLSISPEHEQEILLTFAKEPVNEHEFSGQDMHEQICKILRR